MDKDYATLTFETAQHWREWLDANHASTQGVWLKIYKKASDKPTVTYAEALDVALCYGWIDGMRRSNDAESFLQKFTPRRPKSIWSKRNLEYIARLTEAGLMMPAGMAEVDRAKADGRWEQAYDKPSEMVVPESFLEELRKHPKALAFFETLNKTNTYAIAWRLQTAKTDATRQRRQDKIIMMLENSEKFH